MSIWNLLGVVVLLNVGLLSNCTKVAPNAAKKQVVGPITQISGTKLSYQESIHIPLDDLKKIEIALKSALVDTKVENDLIESLKVFDRNQTLYPSDIAFFLHRFINVHQKITKEQIPMHLGKIMLAFSTLAQKEVQGEAMLHIRGFYFGF